MFYRYQFLLERLIWIASGTSTTLVFAIFIQSNMVLGEENKDDSVENILTEGDDEETPKTQPLQW